MQKSGQISKTDNKEKIKFELVKLEASRQEKFPPEIIKVWLDLFRTTGWSVEEIIKRIKNANFIKRYGVSTTFADFVDEKDSIIDYEEVRRLAREKQKDFLNNIGWDLNDYEKKNKDYVIAYYEYLEREKPEIYKLLINLKEK